MIEVPCDLCGKIIRRHPSEVRRRGGGTFCSLSCSAKASNVPRKSKEFVARCPYCGEEFITSTHNKAKKFCSRSCASKGSMSEERRAAQSAAGRANRKNLLSTAECLRRREAWKYIVLKEVLGERDYQFEFELDGHVFDLALFDVKVLVEFDGGYHRGNQQKVIDGKKEQIAKEAGFKVVRRAVEDATVISPSTIVGL